MGLPFFILTNPDKRRYSFPCINQFSELNIGYERFLGEPVSHKCPVLPGNTSPLIKPDKTLDTFADTAGEE